MARERVRLRGRKNQVLEYDVPSSSRVGDMSVLHQIDIVMTDVHVYTFK